MKPEIIVADSASDVSQRAAELFVSLAEEAIKDHGRFFVAFSGGSTPKATYERLAEEPYRNRLAWDKIQVFWGDERCVPPDHGDSNYRMATEALLSKVPILPENIHRMRGEEKDVDAAAAAYEQEVRKAFGLDGANNNNEIPRFDFVMLGMGDDGHTASLFPGTTALHEAKRLVVSNWVEKFHTYRITMTTLLLNNARVVAFLAPGASKAERLPEVLEGPYEPTRLPSQLIQPVTGRLLWMIDGDAAARLKG